MMWSMNGKRNGKIEWLRLALSVVILLRHSSNFAPEGAWYFFRRGALCVEFFFIVSGYLMACTAAKAAQRGSYCAGETPRFIGRKAAALMPELALAWCVSVLVTAAGNGEFTLPGLLATAMKRIWSLLLLNAAGFGGMDETWYISAMLLAMAALYPLIRMRFDGYVRVIAPLLAAGILGFFAMKTSTPLTPAAEMGIFYKGLLRAFAEISLGAALYPLIGRLSALPLTRTGRAAVTCTEALCWGGALAWMALAGNNRFDFQCLLLIAAGVCLAFSGQGLLADRFNGPAAAAAGRLSLSVYLCHNAWGKAIGTAHEGWLGARLAAWPAQTQYFMMMGAYLALSLGTALAVYHAGCMLRKNKDRIFARLSRMMLRA